MKLLSIEMSRLTTLFHVTRAQGQTYIPHAAAGLVERYSFAEAPQSYAELSADRVDFKHGLFDGSAIHSLEIYEDGIVIESRSDTELIDAFLADLLAWLQSEFGLSMFKSRTIDQMYESNLIIHAEEKIMTPLKTLSALCGQVGEMVALNSGLEVEYQSAGIIVAADQSQISSIKPQVFRLERRFASEFSLNQFVSVAPLKTSQHLEVLEDLERLF